MSESTNFSKYLTCRRALLVVCSVIMSIIVIRFYHLFVTGYMLPDEGYYYESIILDHTQYKFREVFSYIYALFFTGVKSVSAFAFVGAVFASVWGLGTAFLSYKIVTGIGMKEEQASLVLVSLVFFPVYAIMLPMLLTETMALFFGLGGIFFTLRFTKSGRWTDALFASLAFVAAYRTREPYLLLGAANMITVLASDKRNIRATLAYLIPLLLIFPVPMSLWPLEFGDPVYAFLLSLHLGSSAGLPLAIGAPPTVASPSIAAPPFSVNIKVPILDPFLILQAFGIGLFFGYNPLFVVLAVASVPIGYVVAWKRRTAVTGLPPWNALVSLAGYALSLSFFITPSSAILPIWTSTVIRASHVSLPTLFTFDHVYRRIGAKKVIATLLVLLIIGSTQMQLLTNAIQTNLTRSGTPVDRLSFDYRAPYYRLYELALNSGKTIVFAINPRGTRTYLSMLHNVALSRIPVNETEFKAVLANRWDTVYLYDYWITIADPSSFQLYPPYYREILISHSYAGYTVDMLWIDAESYAFKMTQVAPTQT